MNIKLFTFICMLSFPGFMSPLFSQETSVNTIKTDTTVVQLTQEKAGQPMKAMQAQEQECVSTFTDQTVSSEMSVVGCSTLTIQNVTVVNGGNLSLYAPETIIIEGPFEVQPGGLLSAGGTVPTGPTDPVPTAVTYLYDDAGNRIKRQ